MLKYCKSISIYLSIYLSIYIYILESCGWTTFILKRTGTRNLALTHTAFTISAFISEETQNRNCTINNARQQPSSGLRSAQTCRATLGSYIMRPAYYAAIKALWKYLGCTTRSSSALISPRRFSCISLRNAPASQWSRANPEQRTEESLTASSSPKHLWDSARNIPIMNVTSARIYICANITFTGTADSEKGGKIGRTYLV